MQSVLLANFSSKELKVPLAESGEINWKFWRKWLIVLVLVSFIFGITMSVAPYLHMDELMIVDLGRTILHPDTDWSIAWMADKGRPVFFLFYIGPVLQEFSYQIMGQYGPRVSALLGALVAATVVVAWLRKRGTSRNTALLLGIVFLLDPIFVQSYTDGRVDGWTIALCISACWLIRDAKQKTSNSFNIQNLLVGALAVIACFIWPSALFLYPLIVLEMIELKKLPESWAKRGTRAITSIGVFVIGGAIAGTLLLLPIAKIFYAEIDSVIEALKTNTSSGERFGRQTGYLQYIAPIIELLRALKFSPFLPLLALIGCIINRDKGIFLAGLTSVVLMFGTVVYIHRVLYLLPYFIAAASGIFQNERYALGNKSMKWLFRRGSEVVLLAWSVGISLGARSILAFTQKSERERELVYNAGKSMIGPGNHAVFLLTTFELYYTGRSLGWKMYVPYHSIGEPLTQAELHQMKPHIDYAIILYWEVTNVLAQQLRQEGMIDRGWYYTTTDPLLKEDFITTNVDRLRILFRIFRQPYGPYRIYMRDPDPIVSTQN